MSASSSYSLPPQRNSRSAIPRTRAIDVGPMVSSAAADRVEAMIADAVAKGAKLVLKPERRGAILGPAIVAEAPPRRG